MVYFKQLSMDQTEMIDTGVTASQLVANMQSALFRGGMKDARRFALAAVGQIEKVASMLSGTAHEPAGEADIRSPEQLADIGTAEWTNMTVEQKAAVLIEHFVNGATYDPAMCGLCIDLRDVLSTLKLDGVTLCSTR